MTEAAILADRHILGSAATLADAGKATMGWTPQLAGEPAATLASELPWGVPTSRLSAPPRLDGARHEVLSPANLDRLRFAVLGVQGVQGRMAFCVWGAVGERPPNRVVWRVLTHTTLLQEQAFAALAGNPFALITVPQVSAWFDELVTPGAFDRRHEVQPIAIHPSRHLHARAEQDRRAEVYRLRDRLLQGMDAPTLRLWLASIYTGLMRGSVALGSGESGESELLVRLAWLALPRGDRARITFTTEQGRSSERLPRLMVLDTAEWRGQAPPDTLFLASASALEPHPAHLRWAKAVVDAGRAAGETGPDTGHARLHARAARLGACLLTQERADACEQLAGSRGAAGRSDANLAALERCADCGIFPVPGRVGVLAALLTRQPGAPPEEVAASVARVLARRTDDRAEAVRRAVRALCIAKDGDAAAAGCLRLLAVREGIVPPDELPRLAEGGAESRAGDQVVAYPAGAALLQEVVGAHPAQRAALGTLPDRASQTLSDQPSLLEDALGRVELSSADRATSVVRQFGQVQGARPTYETFQQLLRWARVADVRAFLSLPANLPLFLAHAQAAEVRTFLDAVGPAPANLAGALASAGEQPLRTWGAVAIGYLDRSEGVRDAIEAWREAPAATAVTLLLHGAWKPHSLDARAAAAANRIHAAAAEGGQLLTDQAADQIVDTVSRGKGALAEGEASLVSVCIERLAQNRALDRIRECWPAVLERSDPRRLGAWMSFLAKAQSTAPGSAGPLARMHFATLGALLRRDPRGGDAVAAHLAQYPLPGWKSPWQGLLKDAASRGLALGALVEPLLAVLDAQGVHGLAPELWVASLRAPGPGTLSQDRAGLLLRIGAELSQSNPSAIFHDLSLPVAIQLLVQPAPLPLLFDLADAICVLAPEYPQVDLLLGKYGADVLRYSPRAHAALKPQARGPRVKRLLLSDTQIEALHAHAGAAAARAEHPAHP